MGFRRFLSGEDRTVPADVDDDRFVIPFRRVETDEIGLRDDVLSFDRNTSVAVLGQTRSGKTSTITFLAKQMQAARDDPVVVFDYKGDYAEKGIYDPDDAVVLNRTDSTHHWNVFREARDLEDYRAIATALFADEIGREDDFFARAARDVLDGCLRHLDADRSYPAPSNETLLEFLYPAPDADRPPYARIYDELVGSPDRDTRALASDLDPNSPETAANVYQTLRQRVSEAFGREFGRADGDFSIREYVADPRGRTLVLDVSGRGTDVAKPAFRVFLDWSIALAMEDDSSRAHFVLDEFEKVGRLTKAADLITAGASGGTQAVVGVQSRAQIEAAYGDEATAILGNCPQKVLMRTDDDRDYVREQIGRSREADETASYDQRRAEKSGLPLAGLFGDGPRTTVEEHYPIGEQEIASFDRGEAVVTTEDGWVHGRFPLWSDLAESTRRRLAGDDAGTTDAPTVRLVVDGEAVSVPTGEPVGTAIRRVHERAGGDPETARYVHREHVRFDRTADGVALTAVGANDTAVNGRLVPRGERVPVTDGDRLCLADRVEAEIRIA